MGRSKVSSPKFWCADSAYAEKGLGFSFYPPIVTLALPLTLPLGFMLQISIIFYAALIFAISSSIYVNTC
jgi:hypothetical protein